MKSAKGDVSLGHEKTEGDPKEQNITLETEAVEATRTTGEEMEQLGVFTRHISGGDLNEKEVSELENKGEFMGYGPGAMLFGGDQMLMCVPDSDKSKIV